MKTLYLAKRQFMAGQRQITETKTVEPPVVAAFDTLHFWLQQGYLEAVTVADDVVADIRGDAVTWNDPAPDDPAAAEVKSMPAAAAPVSTPAAEAVAEDDPDEAESPVPVVAPPILATPPSAPTPAPAPEVPEAEPEIDWPPLPSTPAAEVPASTPETAITPSQE